MSPFEAHTLGPTLHFACFFSFTGFELPKTFGEQRRPDYAIPFVGIRLDYAATVIQHILGRGILPETP